MIELNNITKTFNKGSINEKIAISELSLKAKDGEFITIIGSNGSGKSTLMNLIAGTIEPDKGKIIIDNIDVTKQKDFIRAKKIGRVFQDPLQGTASDMTIEENLSIANTKKLKLGLQFGVNKKQKEEFQSSLKSLNMNLEDRLKTKVKYLSGGQRQALTLLMASLSVPKVLLLDEHTAALDPNMAELVLSLTNKFANDSNNSNICTLMITHNIEDALKYGNRTIVLRDGKIVLDINAEEKREYTPSKLISKFRFKSDEMLLN